MATPACSAALANVSSPDALNEKSTSGLIGVSQARSTLSRRRSSVAVMYSVARGSLYLAFSTTARTVASSNREMMRAAQNASSGRMFSNAGFGYSGFHDAGSKASASNRPTARGTSGYEMRVQGRAYIPSVASVSQPGFHSRMYSLPGR